MVNVRILSPDVQIGGSREIQEREKKNRLWRDIQLVAATGLTIVGAAALLGALPGLAPLAGNLVMAGGGIGFSAMRERGV